MTHDPGRGADKQRRKEARDAHHREAFLPWQVAGAGMHELDAEEEAERDAMLADVRPWAQMFA